MGQCPEPPRLSVMGPEVAQIRGSRPHLQQRGPRHGGLSLVLVAPRDEPPSLPASWNLCHLGSPERRDLPCPYLWTCQRMHGAGRATVASRWVVTRVTESARRGCPTHGTDVNASLSPCGSLYSPPPFCSLELLIFTDVQHTRSYGLGSTRGRERQEQHLRTVAAPRQHLAGVRKGREPIQCTPAPTPPMGAHEPGPFPSLAAKEKRPPENTCLGRATGCSLRSGRERPENALPKKTFCQVQPLPQEGLGILCWTRNLRWGWVGSL